MKIKGFCFGKLGICVVLAAFLLCGCGKADKYYDKGMEYMEDGDYDEAGKQFKSAIDEDNDEAKYHIGYGMALNYLGKYDEALEELEKGNSIGKLSDGESKQVYYGMAASHYGLGNYESAVEEAKNALDIKKKSGLDSSIRNIQASAYEILGDSDKALTLYEENIKEDGKDKDSYLRSGRLQLAKGQYDAAMEDFNKVIEIDKKCYDAVFGKYDVCISKGDSDAANEIITDLAKSTPENADDYIAVGRAYYLMGKVSEAEDCFNKAAEEKSEVAPYYQGLLFMRLGKYNDAVDSLNNFLEQESQGSISPALAYNQIAGCMIQQGKYKESIDYLSKGLEYGRTSAHKSLLKNLVLSYEKIGSYKKARKSAKDYISVYPDDSDMGKELEFIRTRIKK